MSYYSATWALLLALPLLARAQSTASLPPSGPWGNGPSNGIHWSLDAGQSGAYITYASTTLEVPGPIRNPGGASGALGFYPGLADGAGDLIQSVVATFAQGEPSLAPPCVGNGSMYCLFVYFNGPSASTGSTDVPPPIVTKGDQFTIDLLIHSASRGPCPDTIDNSGHFYNQTVSKKGQVVITNQLSAETSNLTTASPLTEWGPRIECVSDFVGTAPAHVYSNTAVVLNQQAPDFLQSLVKINASNSAITTNDGGKTWTVETIIIDEAHCT